MSPAAHAAIVASLAAPYGIDVSRAPASTGKKYVARLPDGKVVFFGQLGAGDYIAHGDEKKRAAYRARAEGIRLKDGRRAVDVFGTPAWLSYRFLW